MIHKAGAIAMDANNILIVEDEIIIALSLESALKTMGYMVTGIAMSGEDAIKQTRGSHPDLVLMDITLNGEMDGIEAASQIIEKSCIPIIFLTGYSDEIILNRLAGIDHCGVLHKPFDEFSLKLSIENALKKNGRTGSKSQCP
jgi:CheY-like chemotaxis protein